MGKPPTKKMSKDESTDEFEELKRSFLENLYDIYWGKKESVLPLATFVYCQCTCFLLSQIGTTFLVISNFGVNAMPFVTLGVAVLSLFTIPLGTYVEGRLYQRTVVKWATIITAFIFTGFQVIVMCTHFSLYLSRTKQASAAGTGTILPQRTNTGGGVRLCSNSCQRRSCS